MLERLENIPQIERGDRADYLIEFFDHIHADLILSSEEARRDYIKNISFGDFKDLLVRINGILRSTPIKERDLGGKDVALVPDPDQMSEIEKAMELEKSEYPPRETDKEDLLKEMLVLAQKMEAQETNIHDIALLISAAINAIHPFEDGNGRTSRLLNYLITTDYTGSKEQIDFLKKLLGDRGRLLVNVDPGEAKNAITSHLLYNRLNLDPEDRNFPKGLGRTNSEEVTERIEERVPQEILADFKRYVLHEEDDFGFFAVYSFLQEKDRLSDFLSPIKDGDGVIRRTDLRVIDLVEKLKPDEFSEILEKYWQIKKDGVSLLMHALAEPEKFRIEKSIYERLQGKTIKESFISSLDQSYLRSFKEVNMENIEEIWSERDTLPFSTDKEPAEGMRRLAEINAKLETFKDQEKIERAALGFDFKKADEEYNAIERRILAMRGKEFGPEDSAEKIAHDKELEIAQKKLYETKYQIYRPIIELEKRYLEKVIQFLDGLEIWKTKFTTRNEGRFASEEEKEETDSIYYVTKNNQSLRIRKYGLLKDGLSGSIEPFMEKIFFIDNLHESFHDRANVSEQAREGLFVMEYTTDEFQEAQKSFDAKDFTSRIRRFEKNGKIIYLNPVDGFQHKGYSINKFLGNTPT